MEQADQGRQSVFSGVVLVVEDDEPIRKLFLRCLSSDGYEVLWADNGTRALEILEERSVDLVVTDVMMPEIDGIELCRRIRASSERHNLPVIITTAHADRASRIKGREAGCDDFLAKPVDLEELSARVRNLLLVRSYYEHLESYNDRLEEEVRRRTARLRQANEKLHRAEAELAHTQEEMIDRLARAAEFRDEDSRHTRRLGLYSEVIANGLGLDEECCQSLRMAARLHDVGMIGIPESILLKKGKVLPEEFEMLKQHTNMGFRILKGSTSELLRMASIIALTHHEKYDGTGYPRGLSANQIPVVGRICAIADVFDALTSKRSHREPFSIPEAIEIMKKERGKQFDPMLLDIFLGAIDQVVAIRNEHPDGDRPLTGQPEDSSDQAVGCSC